MSAVFYLSFSEDFRKDRIKCVTENPGGQAVGCKENFPQNASIIHHAKDAHWCDRDGHEEGRVRPSLTIVYAGIEQGVSGKGAAGSSSLVLLKPEDSGGLQRKFQTKRLYPSIWNFHRCPAVPSERLRGWKNYSVSRAVLQEGESWSHY